MRMLMAKLIDIKEMEQKEKIEDLQGKYTQITWGSQIRSYVFQPAKLIDIKEMEQKEKIEDLQGKYTQITWGSQIRSYVFQPYKMVKDHRTNTETGNVDAVMNGNIDIFINSYLTRKKLSK